MSGNVARSSAGGWTALGMGLPAIGGLILFVLVPFLMALGLTFTDQRLVSPEPGRFIGLANYERLLSVNYLLQEPLRDAAGAALKGDKAEPLFIRSRDVIRHTPTLHGYRPIWEFRIKERRITILAKDPEFLRSLFNTFLFAAMVVPLQCLVALSLALLVNRGLKGQTLFRALYFSPVVMSMVVVSVVWAFLFDKDLGLLNVLLDRISFGWLGPVDWLGDSGVALPSIALMSAWQGAGFQMLVFLAGLQSIPQELYDAARVDGASAWQRFVHITYPGLRQTIAFVLTVTTIAALGLFTQIDVMTQGGPRGATSTVMFEAIKRGVREENISYGASISAIYFMLIVLIVMAQRFLLSRRGRSGK